MGMVEMAILLKMQGEDIPHPVVDLGGLAVLENNYYADRLEPPSAFEIARLIGVNPPSPPV